MEKLRKIQLIELDALRELRKICNKNDLNYNLAYGTFLGAVRHKGFIPWDDDLDVNMPLRDFRKLEKLCKVELSNHFFLQTPTNDVAPYGFYKLRVNNTRMVEPIYNNLNMHHGIWIDIFPYVYASKNKWGRNLQVILLRYLNRIRARYYYRYSSSIIRRLILCIPKPLYLLIDDLLLTLIEKIGTKSSSMVFELSRCKTVDDNFFSLELIEPVSDYIFEDELFKGPSNSDAYLRKCYGSDYMKPIKYSSHSDLDSVEVEPYWGNRELVKNSF